MVPKSQPCPLLVKQRKSLAMIFHWRTARLFLAQIPRRKRDKIIKFRSTKNVTQQIFLWSKIYKNVYSCEKSHQIILKKKIFFDCKFNSTKFTDTATAHPASTEQYPFIVGFSLARKTWLVRGLPCYQIGLNDKQMDQVRLQTPLYRLWPTQLRQKNRWQP